MRRAPAPDRRKSWTTSSIVAALQGTFSGQGLIGCSLSVFRPLPLITTTTVSSGRITPCWASFIVAASVVPPAGSVSTPSVAASSSIAVMISPSGTAAAEPPRLRTASTTSGPSPGAPIASDWASVSGTWWTISAASSAIAVAIGEQPLGWPMWILVCAVSREADRLELVEALVHARGERPAGRRHDDVVGRVPAELLDDLVGERLRALRVERAQGDVGELQAARFRQLAAGAVGFVVVAVELADLGAERAAAARLGPLQVGRVEDVGREPGLGAERRGRGADVAGRDAADLRAAELERAGDGHADHPVLVGERGPVGRVVLDVEVAQPELGAEAVGADQRRQAGEDADPLGGAPGRRSAAAPRSARC